MYYTQGAEDSWDRLENGFRLHPQGMMPMDGRSAMPQPGQKRRFPFHPTYDFTKKQKTNLNNLDLEDRQGLATYCNIKDEHSPAWTKLGPCVICGYQTHGAAVCPILWWQTTDAKAYAGVNWERLAKYKRSFLKWGGGLSLNDDTPVFHGNMPVFMEAVCMIMHDPVCCHGGSDDKNSAVDDSACVEEHH